MKPLVDLLIRHGLTISSVESFTGGLFGARLCEVPGVSSVYRGSLTAYNERVKSEWLDLDPQWLKEVGTISSACAKVMALRGQERFHSDVCVALTGNAGPNALEQQPVGQWYACIVIGNQCLELSFREDLERNALREHAVETVTQCLINALRELDSSRIHP
jgi:PncC family amidohydrolase